LTILIVTYNINTNARKLVVAMMTICGRMSFGLLVSMCEARVGLLRGMETTV